MSPEIVLDYPCGCRDVWPVSAVEESDRVHVASGPCVPEHCQSCISHGRACPDREGLAAYRPVEWSEVKPQRRTRIKATGTKAWEQKEQSA